jgi:hypothetical protein
MLTVVEQPVSATFRAKSQQMRIFVVHHNNSEIGEKDDEMKFR